MPFDLSPTQSVIFEYPLLNTMVTANSTFAATNLYLHPQQCMCVNLPILCGCGVRRVYSRRRMMNVDVTSHIAYVTLTVGT